MKVMGKVDSVKVKRDVYGNEISERKYLITLYSDRFKIGKMEFWSKEKFNIGEDKIIIEPKEE